MASATAENREKVEKVLKVQVAVVVLCKHRDDAFSQWIELELGHGEELLLGQPIGFRL